MKEIYKDIEGYEGLYQVSNYGNVKSLISKKVLKPLEVKGYLQIGLHKDKKKKLYKIHRLVADTFLDNPNKYEEVNHIDEDKTNNNVTNLEWCTHFYNINYSQSKKVMCIETGLIYTSTMEVERVLGFSRQNISSTCKGKYKTMYGFHWKYV